MSREEMKERIYNFTKELMDKVDTPDKLGKANETHYYYRQGIIDSTPDSELLCYALKVFDDMWDKKLEEVYR